MIFNQLKVVRLLIKMLPSYIKKKLFIRLFIKKIPKLSLVFNITSFKMSMI